MSRNCGMLQKCTEREVSRTWGRIVKEKVKMRNFYGILVKVPPKLKCLKLGLGFSKKSKMESFCLML